MVETSIYQQKCLNEMNDLRSRLYVSTFTENSIENIRDYGLGMEINHTCISENLDSDKREELIDEIKKDIEKSETKMLVMHGPFTEIHPAAIDYKVRELGMKRLNEAYEVAKNLGVKKMIVHTGWLPFIYFKEYQAEKGKEFWEKFMADKPSDFEIAIENVLEDEPYMIRDMMEKIEDERIKLCLDIGHANAMTSKEYSIEDWIKVLSPWISHLHIHNNNGKEDSHSALDEGTMNMNEVFDLIERYVDDYATITIEAKDSGRCLEWLMDNRYI